MVQAPIIKLGLWCGFTNVDYAYVHGNPQRVHLGARCSTMDTVFNVVSGDVWVGDDTFFSHGCQVLTGVHKFYGGRRAGLVEGVPIEETPMSGNDIVIGCRCWIGAGATILAGVDLGDDVIVGAGAVVTKNIPTGAFAAGVPAEVRGFHGQSLDEPAPSGPDKNTQCPGLAAENQPRRRASAYRLANAAWKRAFCSLRCSGEAKPITSRKGA